MQVIVSTTSFPGKPTGDENIATAADLLDEAGRRRSDIVCLPESFTHRRMTVIETLDGPAIRMARGKAIEHRMYVIAPIVERCDNRLYNSSVVIDRRGEIIGSYRKVYPTPGEREKGIVPGDSLPIFETDFGPIAVLTCYDHDWPELFGAYRRLGARIVFWPTMAYGYSEFDHLVLKSTICLDHGLYIVASNYDYWSDPAPAQDYRHTYILSPEGIPLADASYRPGVITAHIDLDYHWPARDHSQAAPGHPLGPWPELLEPFRRSDLYAALRAPQAALESPRNGSAPRASRSVRIGAVNLPDADQPDPEAALRTIDAFLSQLHEVEIAVLPENSLYGGAAEEAGRAPIAASDAQVAALSGLARRHRLYLVASCYRAEKDGLHAVAYLFDPAGEIAGLYRKTHLSRLERDQHDVRAGSELPVFETPLGRVGLLLGRDLFYPEAYAVLAHKGADLVLWGGSAYPFYPNGWQLRHMLMARPVAYGTCLAAAMYSTPRPHLSRKLQRSACVIDQYAQVRADSGSAPGIAEATLELPPTPISPLQRLRDRMADRPELLAPAWA